MKLRAWRKSNGLTQQQLAEAIGLSHANPSTAGIVSLSGAPMTVLLAIVLLGEDVGWRRGVGIALAIGGVVIAISSPSGLQSSAGLGWIGLSCLVGALGSVYVKKIDVGGKPLQAWSALASFVVLLPFSLATERDLVAPLTAHPWQVLGCLIFAGLVVSVSPVPVQSVDPSSDTSHSSISTRFVPVKVPEVPVRLPSSYTSPEADGAASTAGATSCTVIGNAVNTTTSPSLSVAVMLKPAVSPAESAVEASTASPK